MIAWSALLLASLLAGSPAPPPVPAPEAGAQPAPAGLASFERVDLPNGLRTLLGQPRRTALFSEVLLVARAGTGAPGAPQEETARLAAEALTAGRLAPDAPPVRLQLARLGASLDFTVGREVAVFRFAVPTRNTAALLRLLADLLARRGLSDEDWREAVARRGDGLLLEQSDPWQRATARLTGQAWRETAVAAALPAAPGREALASFRARAYAPGRMVLSVWGELPTAAVAEAVRRELGRLPAGAGEPAAAAPPEPARNPGGGVSCLRDEGAVPPALLVGVGAEVESDLTFYGWQVAAHILGASHNSRLQQRLRTETQVVYTVEAACVPVGSRGLTLRIACQTDQVETARAVVLDELRRLTREPVAQAELDLARAILRSRLELDRDSFRDLFYQRSLALLAVPLARNPAAAEEILAGLTPAALHDLLRRTLRPDDAATVVVSAHDESLCEAANGPAGR